jgi:ATPase subunit of ABC transporter with duplicated ATPase domains
VFWLEDFLRKQTIPMILVSHDREFLDQVCNKIVDVEEGKLITYRANYSKFLLQRNERLQSWKERWTRQCNYIKEEENWIKRAKSNPIHSGQVKTRQNALEKYKQAPDFLASPPRERFFRFRFPEPPDKRSSVRDQLLLEVTNVKHGFDNPVSVSVSVSEKGGIPQDFVSAAAATPTAATIPPAAETTPVGKATCLFKNVKFEIRKGDRIGFIGPNGSGKSTMLKLLMKFFPPQSGEIRLMSREMKINYYAQNQADLLDLHKTVLETVSENADSSMTQLQIRTLLGQFLFHNNDVFKTISVLSGGEKSRVSLCKMMLQPSHILLLDEPTNHLDIIAKEVLEDALLHYSGGVIVVSHDRYFMSQIVKTIYEFGKKVKVSNGGIGNKKENEKMMGIVEYDCDYHDYLEELAERELNIARKKLFRIIDEKEEERKIKQEANREKRLKELENELSYKILSPYQQKQRLEEEMKKAELPHEDPGELDLPVSLKDRIESRYIKGDSKHHISKAKRVIIEKKHERTKNFGGSGITGGNIYKGIKNAKRFLKKR